MYKMTKKFRLLNGLTNGHWLSARQIRQRYSFASTNSARGTITDLRDEGYNILTIQFVNKAGNVANKYFLKSA